MRRLSSKTAVEDATLNLSILTCSTARTSAAPSGFQTLTAEIAAFSCGEFPCTQNSPRHSAWRGEILATGLGCGRTRKRTRCRA